MSEKGKDHCEQQSAHGSTEDGTLSHERDQGRDLKWEESVAMSRMLRLRETRGEAVSKQAAENLKTLYRSLPIDTNNRQIRLLTLHPASLGGFIECTLKRASLNIAQSYEALSYTWASTGTSFIKANGSLIPVSADLEDTLSRLELKDSSRTLWIDAICINQEDILEKNKQVVFMRVIYQSAKRTIVWLGNNNPFEKEATSYARDTDSAMAVIEKWNTQLKAERQRQLQEPLKQLVPDYDKLYIAFSTMASKRWWRRIWIVQEVSVSKNVIVGCGRSWTDWAPFVEYSKWIRKARKTPWQSEFTMFHQMIDISTRHRDHGATSLHTLLKETSGFDATDSRDKVYALLGLSTEQDRAAISVDYSGDVTALYADVARHIIRSEQSLSILALAGANVAPDAPTWSINGREVNLGEGMQTNVFHGTESNMIRLKQSTAINGMPSWVTNFQGAGYTRAQMRYPLESSHCASGSLKPKTKFRESGFLVVEGIIFDAVSAIVPLEMPSTTGIDLVDLNMNSPPPHLDLIERLASSALNHQIPSSDARSRLKRSTDDLWRTLILNRGHKGKSPAGEDFGLMYECIRGRGKMPEDYNPDYIENCGGSDDSERVQFQNALFARNFIFKDHFQGEWKKPPGGTLEFVHNSFYAREGRRFFLTRSGFVGMGPQKIQKDDIVVVVFGCHVPLVLREVEGCYKIIGECYVHGIMNGELVRDLEGKGVETATFEAEIFNLG